MNKINKMSIYFHGMSQNFSKYPKLIENYIKQEEFKDFQVQILYKLNETQGNFFFKFKNFQIACHYTEKTGRYV